MSIMKDIGRSFLKYSEKVVNKTDNLTQIAKLNIEIKKTVTAIEDTKTKIGNSVLKKYESGSETISFTDSEITEDLQLIGELKGKIEGLKKALDEVKKKKEASEVSGARPDSEEDKE